MTKRLLLSVLLCICVTASALLCMSGASSYAEIFNECDTELCRESDETILSTYYRNNTPKGEVYLGGQPLGIDVKSEHLVICGKQDVITRDGTNAPCKDIDIEVGDRLIAIDDSSVRSRNDIATLIRSKTKVVLTIEHRGKIDKYMVYPAIDALTGCERLGLILKDGITGIGTMTYIDPNTRRYGALGHPIEQGQVYRRGTIFTANITGNIRGVRGKAGELNGEIDPSNVQGIIDKNTDYGIFGVYTGDYEGMRSIKIGSREDIKVGKAQIYTTIEGASPREYDIEIIKKVSQSKPDTKGMVIRITDKALLSRTGGILQGMSGSPIVQNGKLIGAVTHVFINDPTKGYGVYLDFMSGN